LNIPSKIWRKLHNEVSQSEIFIKYSDDPIKGERRVRWVEHVTCRQELRNALRTLFGKPEAKGQLKRQRCNFQDNSVMLRITGLLDFVHRPIF
jgi:hypothetical protein